MEYLTDTRPPAAKQARKGSNQRMWEILLQLRDLLPHLARLAPLLDRGLKAPPEFTQLSREVTVMQSGTRELEVQARNQALQLERIEQQLSRLGKSQENIIENTTKLLADARSLRRWAVAAVAMMSVLLATAAGIVALLLHHA
jgi:hypothetical protein